MPLIFIGAYFDTSINNGISFYAETSLRGYHVYKDVSLTLGEKLFCQEEPDNEYDEFAVVVQTYHEETVGHLPIQSSELVHTFICDGGEAEAEVIGCRFNAGNGMGLEVPIDIKFSGTFPYLRSLRSKLQLVPEITNFTQIEGEN